MTTPTLVQMKDQIKRDWTDNAAAWRKWHDKFVRQTSAATTSIVEATGLEPGMHVLDLASGTGEPAFSLARAVGPIGRVTATDLVPEMLEVVREKGRGLRNLAIEVADMENLQYTDESFDRVTCRFGIMFCPNVQQALAEILRVLKTGGRVVFIVWASPAQPYFEWLSYFSKRAQLPPPPPNAPTGFRFAKPGSLTKELGSAGFRNISETAQTIQWNWPGSAAENWEMQREIVPQLLERFRSALSPSDYEAASAEALASYQRREEREQTCFEAQVYLVVAHR